jgi:hypothetical protein
VSSLAQPSWNQQNSQMMMIMNMMSVMEKKNMNLTKDIMLKMTMPKISQNQALLTGFEDQNIKDNK